MSKGSECNTKEPAVLQSINPWSYSKPNASKARPGPRDEYDRPAHEAAVVSSTLAVIHRGTRVPPCPQPEAIAQPEAWPAAGVLEGLRAGQSSECSGTHGWSGRHSWTEVSPYVNHVESSPMREQSEASAWPTQASGPAQSSRVTRPLTHLSPCLAHAGQPRVRHGVQRALSSHGSSTKHIEERSGADPYWHTCARLGLVL